MTPAQQRKAKTMTDKQRSERIHHLVMAGADLTRRPRRPMDQELHTLLSGANPAATGSSAATRRSLASERPERVRFAVEPFADPQAYGAAPTTGRDR